MYLRKCNNKHIVYIFYEHYIKMYKAIILNKTKLLNYNIECF